jgi:hypothetical protein
MCRYNEKTGQDNKKHKRNLSSPIFFVRDHGNVFKPGERIGTSRNGKFPGRIFPTFNRENMAGAVSDDPSMSRMTNGMLVNGNPVLFNGTDSELDGQFGHSAIQLHHQNSVMNVTNNTNETGMYNIKSYCRYYFWDHRYDLGN